MIFVGVDWAEAHNDVLVMDEGGVVLGRGRCATGVAGLAQLHALVADHAEEPREVIVGIEIDRGLLVDSLTAAGYRVYGVNPLAASRYRDRHTTSGAKSDAGDAKLLADLVRTDRHNHRPVAGDTEQAGAIRVLARAHQGLVWTRQRQVNALRSALRDYFPAALCAFGTDLAAPDALAILKRCPDASARPGALTGQDRRDAATGGSPAQHRPARHRDLCGAAHRAARGPFADRRGLRRRERGQRGRADRAQSGDRRARASDL
jgi:transposase